MQANIIKKLIVGAFLFWTVGVWAVDSTSTAPTTTAASATSYLPNIKFVEQLCPNPSQLVRGKDLIWRAPGDWKSYGESFASEIARFADAQWQGVNLGKIICVYIGKGRTTFPIMLERELIVPEPTGHNWAKNQGGYKNCKSEKVADCPFLEEKTRDVTNVYDELDFYKGKKDTE